MRQTSNAKLLAEYPAKSLSGTNLTTSTLYFMYCESGLFEELPLELEIC